jgi:integrase
VASSRIDWRPPHGAEDTPKSEAGERTIALGPKLAEELWQHRRRTAFAREDERVFCHPEKGTPLDHKRYAATLKRALARAKVEKPMRPFHDGRHTSITNSAAAGLSPAALMARAGHSDFKTTQAYIDLAGGDIPGGGRASGAAPLWCESQTDSLSAARPLVTPDMV